MAFGYRPLSATFAELNRQMEVNRQRENAHEEKMASIDFENAVLAQKQERFDKYERPMLEQKVKMAEYQRERITPNVFQLTGTSPATSARMFTPQADGTMLADKIKSAFTNEPQNYVWNASDGNLIHKTTGQPLQTERWQYNQQAGGASALMLAHVDPMDALGDKMDDLMAKRDALLLAGKSKDMRIYKNESLINKRRLTQTEQEITSIANMMASPSSQVSIYSKHLDTINQAKAHMMAQGASADQLKAFDDANFSARNKVANIIEMEKLRVAQLKGQKGTKPVFDRIKVHNSVSGEERSIAVADSSNFDPQTQIGAQWRLGEAPAPDKDGLAGAMTENQMMKQIERDYSSLDKSGQFFISPGHSDKIKVARSVANAQIKPSKRVSFSRETDEFGKTTTTKRGERVVPGLDRGTAAVIATNFLEREEKKYWAEYDRIVAAERGKERNRQIGELNKKFKNLMRAATEDVGVAVDYIPTPLTRNHQALNTK
jgi:hypothetical protein